MTSDQKHHFIVTECIFNRKVHIFLNYTSREVDEYLNAYFKERGVEIGEKETRAISNEQYDREFAGFSTYIEFSDRPAEWVVSVRDFTWKIKDQGTLIHELAHTITKIWGHNNIKVNLDTQEFFCHSLSNLYEDVAAEVWKLDNPEDGPGKPVLEEGKPMSEKTLFNQSPTAAVAVGSLSTGEMFKITEGDVHEYPPPGLWAEFEDGSKLRFNGVLVETNIKLRVMNSMSRDEIKPTGACIIHLNSNPAYGFNITDPVQGLNEAAGILKKLLRHPVIKQWTKEEIQRKVIGRRVWYHGEPAVITEHVGEFGTVRLVPAPEYDAVFNHKMSPACNQTFATDDILSPHINWFRGQEAE